MKSFITILVAVAMVGCSGLNGNVQNILNNPAVQSLISQAEAFAIQFAQQWIASHLGGARHMAKAAYQPGISELKTALMVQKGLSEQVADIVANDAFAKATK